MSVSSTRPSVRILHQLARSGGTLISQCLGSMDGVLLLSEIHPYGASELNPFEKLRHRLNPLNQAIVWYRLFTPAELQELTQRQSVPFDEIMLMIEAKCRARGLTLVVRDWTHLDYVAAPFLPEASYRLTTAELLTERFDVIHTATVRHPLDQWLSLMEIKDMHDKFSLADYLLGCRRFAEECTRIGFLRYEDFVRAPQDVLRELCRRLQLDYDPEFIGKWPDNNRITGDRSGRGRDGREIRALPRRAVAPDLLDRFEANDDYRATLALLGYRHPEPGAE